MAVVILVGFLAAIPAPSAWGQGGEMRLSLGECIERALENNLDLQVSRFNPEIAATDVEFQQSQFDSTLTSSTYVEQQEIPVFPASFGVEFQDSRRETVGFEDFLLNGLRYNVNFVEDRSFLVFQQQNPDFSGPIYSSSLFIDITQPLLKNRGKKNNATQIRVARNNYRISEQDYQQSVLNTLKAVEEAYWELVFSTRDLQVRKQSLERAKRFLEENRVKVEVGTLAPIEITTAEAEVASRMEDVIVGENAVENAQDVLRVLISSIDEPLWDERIITLDEPPLRDFSEGLEVSIQTALDRRPDLEKQRLTVENEDMNLKFRKNQRKHQLDLVGRYGAQGQIDSSSLLRNPNFDPGLPPDPVTNPLTIPNPDDDKNHKEALEQVGRTDFDTWRFTLNWTVAIGNREAKSQYAAAKLQREQSVVNYQLLRQTAIREVRSAHRQIETDRQRVEAARVNKRLQQEKLDAEEKKYENGMSTSFQVLEFQEDLAEAERSEIRAIIDYNLSMAELEKVKGTLAHSRGVVLE